MKSFYALVFCLLLSQSLGQDVGVMPRKHNMVSEYLNMVLGQIFDEIFGTNFIAEEIDLGENVGKFLNVQLVISGGLSKDVDGYKAYGFKLITNVTDVSLNGQYDIVNLDVPGLFPFFGKGDFNISLGFVNLNMLLDAPYDFAEEKFNIEIPRFSILVENSTVKFDNLMNDPHVADFLNELLSNLLPDVVTMLTEPLLTLAKPAISYLGNGILTCIKTKPSAIKECIEDLFKGPTSISEYAVNLTKYIKMTDLRKLS